MRQLFIQNKIIFFVSFALILYQYFISFFFSNLNLNDLLFLSIGYPSDPVILPLIIDYNKYIFSNVYHFSNILYLFPENLIFKIFGFKFIWVTAIIYKLFFYFIILKILFDFNKTINKKNFFIFSLILVILLTSNFGGNIDRLIRPSLLNIFQAILILVLYKCYFKKFISKLDIFFLAISSAATLSMAPWNFFFIIPLFFINIKNLTLIKFSSFLFFFLLFYFPNLKSNYEIITNPNNHLDYQGIKEIYDIKTFLFDYFYESLKSKKILFGIFFIFIFSLFFKNIFFLKILFFSIIFAFLPYILISKTILSYHILQGFFDFLFLTCIFISFNLFCNNEKIKNYLFFYEKFFIFFFISAILLYPIFFPNTWIVRSDKIKLEYKKHFINLDKISEKKTIVSNDKYIRFYLHFMSRNYLPIDGFFNVSNPEITYKSIANIINLKKNSKNDFLLCMFIKTSTENLFDSTRSTMSKNITYSVSEFEKLKEISSTSGWILTIPLDVKNRIYELIENNKKDFYYYDYIHGYTSFGAEKEKCKFDLKIN